MALKRIVNDLSEVPEGLRGEYEPHDGKHRLKLEGDDDPVALKRALEAERKSRSALDSELKAMREKLGDTDPAEAKAAMVRIRELEDARGFEQAKTKEELEKLIEQRTERMRADFAAKENAYKKNLGDSEGAKSKLNERLSELLIDHAITEAAIAAGVRKSAIADVILRARQLYTIEDGKPVPKENGQIKYGKDASQPMPPAEWVGTLTASAPHLFETSAGGGAPGTGSAPSGGGLVGRVVKVPHSQARDPQAYRTLKDKAEKEGFDIQLVEG